MMRYSYGFMTVVLCLLGSDLSAQNIYALNAGNASGPPGSTVDVTVTLDAGGGNNITGYTYSLCSDDSVVLSQTISMGADVQATNNGDGPDFYQEQTNANNYFIMGGCAVGVVISFFDNDTLAAVDGIETDVINYELVGAVGDSTSLDFCSTLGAPTVIVSIAVEGPDPNMGEIDLNSGQVAIALLGEPFIRGDADGDGIFNGLVDALFTLNFQFAGGPVGPCLEAMDADGDGNFSGLVDALLILAHQFQAGPPPPAPYPECGNDPDPVTTLGCDGSSCP